MNFFILRSACSIFAGMKEGMNREILRIALPAIVANITVPLLGLVDTAIAGHLGDKVFIGAVAVGAMMFNLVYWNFGFLRMSTSGMTAQTCGSGDFNESAKLLGESTALAIVISALIIALQWPIRLLLLWRQESSLRLPPLLPGMTNLCM